MIVMKLQKVSEMQAVRQMTDCKLFVRVEDLTVVMASELYYEYVGENSYLPLSALLTEADGELLAESAGKLTEPLEMVTTLTNGKEHYRNIYLRMEPSSQTENANPLYEVTIFDINDIEKRVGFLEGAIAKHRHFMSLNNYYYFEYDREKDKIVLYRYVNERALNIYSGTLGDFAAAMEKYQCCAKQKEQLKVFVTYLQNGSAAFEMELTMYEGEEESVCQVKGGRLYKSPNFVVGVMMPGRMSDNEAYYLTSAARDAGTGLLNKKAATEYSIEKLSHRDGQTRWSIILDIDDFKTINDTYGHQFGDVVISRVAEILQVNVGYRGMVGRFGGDEFYVFLEKMPDRTALKNFLKTVVKEMMYAFDPQLRVTASIGVSQYPVDGEEYETLFAKADKALYVAKAKGKNRHIIYEERLHGETNTDDMKNMAVAYAVSKAKKREALADVLNEVYLEGIGSITTRPLLLEKLRELFDLDGITIYTDYGKRLLSQSGNYMCEAPEEMAEVAQEEYWSIFGEDDMLVETTMLHQKERYPKLYQRYAQQEIGACIHCMARRDKVPFAVIAFDVFNRNRKWSDTDIELLGVIGKCIGRVLCNAAKETGEE